MSAQSVTGEVAAVAAGPAGSLTLSRAAQAFGGTLLYPDCCVGAVNTDTRTLGTGELFVALRGERFDGHRFLEQAALNACGLVVETPDKALALPQWVVPDTARALGQLAALRRDDFSGSVIAITGSGGKTTVKEMLAAILACEGEVLATKGNLNNHIGVPLTLLGLESRHRYGVIEMGASGAGEIDYLCSIARPDVAVITNVLPAHVAGFGSLRGVAAAKGEIYHGLHARGTAVLNIDESWCQQWRRSLKTPQVITFSQRDASADCYASEVDFDVAGCANFRLHCPRGEIEVQLAVPGAHNISNALAAAACAVAVDASLINIAAGLSACGAAPGRMQVLVGRGGARVIDDSYNANPGSVRAAVDALRLLPGRHLLVLGDMAELGARAKIMHREVGEYAGSAGLEGLWACGELSAAAVHGFGSGGRHFQDREALAEALEKILAPDLTVLIKGSRSAGMEAVVARITEEGGHAAVAD